MRWILTATAVLIAAPATAQTCLLDFTVEITQGVGMIPPGTHLPGSAQFTTSGQSFRQEGGATGHLAMGHMTIGDDITGEIWTLITTARGHAAELVGVYANDVEGLSFAGTDFEGPMTLTLYGAPGTRASPQPPVTQAEWDNMDLRRAFSLHADSDMLAGDVIELTVNCT